MNMDSCGLGINMLALTGFQRYTLTGLHPQDGTTGISQKTLSYWGNTLEGTPPPS